MELEEKKLDHFKGQARLPKFAVPSRYDLTIKLDLSECNFSGMVLIDVNIKEATKFLVLNSLELDVHRVSFTTSPDKKYVPSNIVVDGDDEILVLVFEESLEVGSGVLEIVYSGVLNENLKGLYRCTYLDKGEKKNMVATQFEAVDARRCFPCWDEPALKATFKITLESIPSELTAISNMPSSEETLNGNFKTVHFQESVLMSTYLVAFVVGLFGYIEGVTNDGGVKVRVYGPVSKIENGKFALDIALRALDFFSKYFSMPYPLPKLDMVAVPEFSGGAMENYGLITYRDQELFLDESHSAASNIHRLTIVVAHEVAHHWFGNLVTMEWWTHLWLNEGFATWVSYLVADIFFPEWKIWNSFLKETVDGLRKDALEQSHPIEVEIPHAGSILEYFDEISYNKGSAVIWMLQSYLGDEVFQKSLGSYMKRHAFRNAKTEDLWSVLSETSGVDVNKMMDTWTKQQGYPVISVTLTDDNTLEFEQKQFMYSSFDSDSQWIIPLTLALSSYNEPEKFLLESKSGKLIIDDISSSRSTSDEENQWIKLNVNQAGFYRVKYDDNLADRLLKAIADNSLSAADEFGILDDMVALCEACLVPFTSLLRLIDTYRKDHLEYIVLSRLIDVCYSASNILKEAIPELVVYLKQFFIDVLQRHAEKLGWDHADGESQLNALTRGEVLLVLSRFDHPQTIDEATNRFEAYLKDQNSSALPADSRRAAYTAVMRKTTSSDRGGLQRLLNIYKEADAEHEKTRILRCIASSPDPIIVKEVLDFLLTDEFPTQDVVYVLPNISWEGRVTAWTWLKTNWDLISKKWGEMLLSRFIRDIITPLCSYEMADDIEGFFASRSVPSITMILKQSLELVRVNAKWVEHIKEEQQLLQELVRKLASK